MTDLNLPPWREGLDDSDDIGTDFSKIAPAHGEAPPVTSRIVPVLPHTSSTVLLIYKRLTS